MKFAIPSFAAWIAAAIFSAVVSLPWLPYAASSQERYTLEVDLVSSVTATAQVYFDIGQGLNETFSTHTLIETANQPTRIRLPLPAARYRYLRFDPLNRAGTIVIQGARLVEHDGAVEREIRPDEWLPENQIDSLTIKEGALTIVTTPGGMDPSVKLKIDQPFELSMNLRRLVKEAVIFSLPIFFAAMAFLAISPMLAPIPRFCARHARQRPIRALFAVAAGATVLSSYPVIFLGKSFVSPNYGASLVYDRLPTLPGYTDARFEDPKGSDVGAIMWQHIPLSFIQRDAMKHGELPLWNRYNASGVVLLGQGQSMFGDPLHFLTLAAGADAWAWDLKYLLAKCFFCFAMGLLAWRAAGHIGIATIICGGSAFIGFFIYRVNHPAFFSFCYSPWILVAWLSVVKAADLRRSVAGFVGLLLANWSVLNSGTAKEAYMLLLSFNATGALILILSDLTWRQRLARLSLGVVTGVEFALISAPVWLNFLQELRQSVTEYDRPSAFQVHPVFLAGLFDEIFYRPLQFLERVSNPSANFLFLAGFLYLLATWRRSPPGRLANALAIAGAGAFAMAFGLVPPQWIENSPFLGNVAHIDNCFSLVLIVLLGMLAALGFRAAEQRLRTPEGRGDLFVVTLLLAALLIPWIAITQTVHKGMFGPETSFAFLPENLRLPVSDFVWGSLLVLPLAVVCGLVALRRALVKGQLTIAQAVMLALCACVILWRHGQHNQTAFGDYVQNPTQRASFFATSPSIKAVQADHGDPFRVAGTEGNLAPGWTETYGFEGIAGPEALQNARYREIVDALGLDRAMAWRVTVHPESFDKSKGAFDFLGLKYYFDTHDGPGQLRALLATVTKADLDVYRSDTAWPRAFFTPTIERYAQPVDLARLIKERPGKPFAAVQIGDAAERWATVPTGTNPPEDQRVVAPARDYRLSTNTTRFTVNSTGPGLIVLHEAGLPRGFRAKLNGERAQVLRVNHAFKAVPVAGPGEWRVEFSYWPRNFTTLLLLALLGLGGVTGMIVWSRSKAGSST